jgi:hypothetical protein
MSTQQSKKLLVLIGFQKNINNNGLPKKVDNNKLLKKVSNTGY